MRERIRNAQARLLDEGALRETLALLAAEGRLAPEEATRVEAELSEVRSDSLYVLQHLGAHLGIGAARATLAVVPLGSILRGTWVTGARLYEELRGRRERARVHSLKVFAVAVIPLAGYLSYLLPLRSVHPTAAWIYANHVSFIRSGHSLAKTLEGKPRFLVRLVEWIAPPPPDPARLAGGEPTDAR